MFADFLSVEIELHYNIFVLVIKLISPIIKHWYSLMAKPLSIRWVAERNPSIWVRAPLPMSLIIYAGLVLTVSMTAFQAVGAGSNPVSCSSPALYADVRSLYW